MSKKKKDKSKHGKRYSELKKKRALALLRRKVSVAKVARAVTASPRTIRRWASAASVPLPHEGRQYDREAIRKALKRKTVAQVCAQFGCSERYARGIKSGELN